MTMVGTSFTNLIPNRSSHFANRATVTGRIRLLGMPIDMVTESEVLETLSERISRKQGTWVVTPNLDILRQYYSTPSLRPMFHSEQGGADMLVADGMPLIWASRLGRIGGHGLPQRVAGSGLVNSLSALAAEKGYRIFMLGGNPGAADRAATVLRQRHPNIQIVGTCCPPVGFDNNPLQMEDVRQTIVEANPDIVYVALGFPKQEKVTQFLRKSLPDATFLGIGISLSFIAGEVKRAPKALQRLGLEWVYRMVQEPRRLARRYLVHDLPFALFRLLPFALSTRLGIMNSQTVQA